MFAVTVAMRSTPHVTDANSNYPHICKPLVYFINPTFSLHICTGSLHTWLHVRAGCGPFLHNWSGELAGKLKGNGQRQFTLVMWTDYGFLDPQLLHHVWTHTRLLPPEAQANVCVHRVRELMSRSPLYSLAYSLPDTMSFESSEAVSSLLTQD